MKSLSRNLSLLFVLAAPGDLCAQGTAGRAVGVAPMAPRAYSMPRPAGVHASVARRGVPPPGAAVPGPVNQNFMNVPALTGNNFDLSNLLNNVPGLGFDYPHLAAISGNLGEEALLSPATQAQLELALRLRQSAPWFGFGGSFYAVPDDFYEPEPAPADAAPPSSPQPQVIVVQVPPTPEPQAPAPVPAAEDDKLSAPLPDVGDFILVTKEGQQITAGAFYHQGADVVYITPSGARRVVPFSDLNVDATALVNQERGTDLQNLL